MFSYLPIEWKIFLYTLYQFYIHQSCFKTSQSCIGWCLLFSFSYKEQASLYRLNKVHNSSFKSDLHASEFGILLLLVINILFTKISSIPSMITNYIIYEMFFDANIYNFLVNVYFLYIIFIRMCILTRF